MKKKLLFSLLVLALGMAFIGCSDPSSSISTANDPLVYRSTSGGKTVEITISRTDLSKAVLTPRVGDFYMVKLSGAIISKGKITSTKSDALTFTPSADSPGPKTAFTATVDSTGKLDIPIIPCEGGDLTDIKASPVSRGGSSGSSGGGSSGIGIGNKPVAKTIVITLGTDALGLVMDNHSEVVAYDGTTEGSGDGVVSGNRVTFELYKNDNNGRTTTRWTGSGPSTVSTMTNNGGFRAWVYGNGHEVDVWEEDAEKISISAATTTIASSKFAEYDYARDQAGPINVKTLTIVGLNTTTPELTATTHIYLYRDVNSMAVSFAESGTANIADGTLTFNLLKHWKNEPWKGQGGVYILISSDGENWTHHYDTAGGTAWPGELFTFTDGGTTTFNDGRHIINLIDLKQ